MNEIKLELPAGVERAEFRVTADSMSKFGRAVEVLLAECNYNRYTLDVDNLWVDYNTIEAVDVGVVRATWGPWSCRITLQRKS